MSEETGLRVNKMYEIQAQCLMLKKRCHYHGLGLAVEPGCRVMHEGKSYRVLAVRKEQLALIQEMTALPVQEGNIHYLTGWLEDDRCVIVPTIEMLLQIVFDATGFFPTLVPGVEASREVWKVQHPAAEQPYIFRSALEALLELAVALLQQERLD